MSAAVEPGRPRLWKYLLAAAILLAVLIPAWTLFVAWVIQPPTLMQEQTLGARHVLWFIAIPVLVVFGLVGTSWQTAAAQSRSAEQARLAQAQVQAQAAAAAAEQARREYVLEVIGLGVTLDKYRQGKLWEALGQGHPYATIRERDPMKYPWSADEKEGMEGSRQGDTLENGARFTPMYWGIPTFAAVSPADDPRSPVSAIDPAIGVPAGAVSSGMAWHLFVAAGWQLAERPDRLLERVFGFFDANPDVPYVVLSATSTAPKARPRSSRTATTSPRCPTVRRCSCWPGASGWRRCGRLRSRMPTPTKTCSPRS